MRIVLADDHDLVRDAIAGLLMQDVETEVVCTEDLDTAMKAVREKGPFDVVMLDLNMPGMNGLGGAQRMVEIAKAPVILISGTARREDVKAALAMGVKGFIPKTISGKALSSAVRIVAGGETYAPTEFLQAEDRGDRTLTPREADVLGQLRHGSSNKEIARVLSITETTVKLHLRSIGEKLEARNRLEIVIKALEAQLI